MGYNNEDGTYIILRVEEIANKTNSFMYSFSCNNCTSTTGQYLTVYDFKGSTETTDGPYFAEGKVKSVVTEQPEATLGDGFSVGNVIISNIQLSPPSPATLNVGERLDISFDYVVISSSVCSYIWVGPYLNDRPVSGYTEPSYCNTGSGQGHGFFEPLEGSEGTNMYDLRFTMQDGEEGEEYFYTLPVNYTISQRSSESSYPTLGNKAVDKFNNPLNANSTLNGGISVNGGGYVQRVEQNLSDLVDVTGTIAVDSAHVGSTVNIFVYAKATLPSLEAYFMLGENFEILTWDLNPANLVAFQRNVPLLPVQTVTMYNGNFIYPGTLEIFFGYQLADGTLVSNSTPIEVAIYADSYLRVKRPDSPEE